MRKGFCPAIVKAVKPKKRAQEELIPLYFLNYFPPAFANRWGQITFFKDGCCSLLSLVLEFNIIYKSFYRWWLLRNTYRSFQTPYSMHNIFKKTHGKVYFFHSLNCGLSHYRRLMPICFWLSKQRIGKTPQLHEFCFTLFCWIIFLTLD